MTSDPNATPAQWANSLSDEELATQLRNMINDPHKLERADRNALFEVAAKRLIA